MRVAPKAVASERYATFLLFFCLSMTTDTRWCGPTWWRRSCVCRWYSALKRWNYKKKTAGVLETLTVTLFLAVPLLHYLWIYPGLGTTVWALCQCPTETNTQAWELLRSRGRHDWSKLLMNSCTFETNRWASKLNKGKSKKNQKNAVVLVLLSRLWDPASATSHASLIRSGRKPALYLVSSPLTRRLKVICWESLVQSRRHKFLVAYNISGEEFQSQGIDRSQLFASFQPNKVPGAHLILV